MNRRRVLQEEYNKKNKITPKTIQKAESEMKEFENKSKSAGINLVHTLSSILPQAKHIPTMIKDIERQMTSAADNLNFELAAELRDRLFELKDMTVWQTSKNKKGKYKK
jgi:excinuclease ABC subunit B